MLHVSQLWGGRGENRARVSPRLPSRYGLGQLSFESLTGAGLLLPARHAHGSAGRPGAPWLLLSNLSPQEAQHVASSLRVRSLCKLILEVMSQHHLQEEVRHRILPTLREEVILEVPITSGGRGHSHRGKLHRGGVLCRGSCRVSRSWSGSHYWLLSWLL